MMNAGIWNVRGLNRRDHQVAVKELISESRLQFLGLLETRVSAVNVSRVQTFLPHWSWFTDYAGPVTVVYGANDAISRRGLWQKLVLLANSISDIPWIVGGDFNAVLDMSEVCGASADIHLAMTEFRDCLLDTGLIHLPPMANSYYHCLNARTSDHSPLVIRGDTATHTVSMFRFDNYLTMSSDFTPSVQNIWRHRIEGTAMYAVTRKLRALKPVFRSLRQKKGDLSLNVKLAAEFLGKVQQLLEGDRHNTLLIRLEKCCKLVFFRATKLEQNMLQQRAKIQWLKGGDQCSRIFFRKVAMRRAAKRVFQITNEAGRILTEHAEVVDEFVSFFQRLLGGERRREFLDLRYLRPWARHVVTPDESMKLVQSVTREEIKDAFFDIAEDKAPGPDGYSSGFYKAAWPVIGEEVVKAILEFFTTGRLLKQVNTTILALIPKVRMPSLVSDFRPISCCNVLYKVITKIIVQRLRSVLDKIDQSLTKCICPGPLYWGQYLTCPGDVSGYNRQGLPMRCALKVDLRKAYDTVEWDFLSAVLHLFGFPDIFIGWIEECVTTPMFSFASMGTLTGSSRAPGGCDRGIRCPRSCLF
ncbi:UNVERIFIED_CONTAM: hypothetical protein Scaly_3145000 [Sesamum calycinum]|uniref:Reverse transcriptase n=1 Tax=Sesamum calycinum TaxID=2727403 RepID=A0AAW2JFY1_9LAMI